MRVVFDTNTVISALLFKGKLTVLVNHWQKSFVTTLVCEHTLKEFERVLAYPKFKLSQMQIDNLIASYLPFTEIIEVSECINTLPQCRDNKDQMFLELALIGNANILVTGDLDLLELNKQVPFDIIMPIEYLNKYFP